MPKESHRNCLLCGTENAGSLGLRFEPHETEGVKAAFQGSEKLQGYDGILHGGIIASLLDSAMTNCLFRIGVKAVTGDLQVRYKHSVPCDARVEVQASLVQSYPPLYRLKSRILMDGKTMARGQARFMEMGRAS
ncbi:PaaI family thioesterase [Pontiellaceae bacterium B12227]|nr:PaaI family thioesterase [Pontiellaceae bacterium B12227]